MTTIELKNYFESKKAWIEAQYQKELDALANTVDEPLPKFVRDSDEEYEEERDNKLAYE